MLLLLGIFISLLGAPVDAFYLSNVVVAQQFNSISGDVSDNRRNLIPDLQVELQLQEIQGSCR